MTTYYWATTDRAHRRPGYGMQTASTREFSRRPFFAERPINGSRRAGRYTQKRRSEFNAKRAVHRGMQMDHASGLEFESFLVSTIYGTEDKQEGISAFLEKRQADFKGR